MAKKKANKTDPFTKALRESDNPGEMLEAAEVIHAHPWTLAGYKVSGLLQMEPAQLLAFLLVNVLGVERRGFAKQLGISPARLSQYTKGLDHVPDKRRYKLAVFGTATANWVELEFRRFETEVEQTREMKRIVGSVIRNAAREVHELADMEIDDLAQKGFVPTEDTAA